MILLGITPFKRSDLIELHELNASLVDQWYQYNGNSKTPVSGPEELTVIDRFMAGGPWLDFECLAIHVKEMTKIGKIVLLRDDETGELLGELEYHNFENTCHIDWMMVRKDLQKRGLGSKLIDWLIKGQNSKIDSIWTEPEEGVEGFYKQNQFQDIFPPFHRFQSNGTQKLENENVWIETIPTGFDNAIGDDINDNLYRNLLLKTQVQYAELFESDYPLHYQERELYGAEVLVVKRDLQPLKSKSSIFILTREKMQLSNIQVGDYLEQVKTDIASDIAVFTTFTDLTKIDLPTWEKMRDIPRLRRKL